MEWLKKSHPSYCGQEWDLAANQVRRVLRREGAIERMLFEQLAHVDLVGGYSS